MLLTNQWTEYSHGHARTELILVKEILRQRGVPAEILSVSSDFGDVHLKIRKFSWFIPHQIIRGPLYRINEKFVEHELARVWERALSKRKHDTSLMITSGFWSQLLQALQKHNPNGLSFRLISPPENSLAMASDIQLVRESIESKNLFLGVETIDGLEYLFTQFGIKAKLVPPLTTIVSQISEGKKLGIFWSVTDSATVSEINSLLSLFDAEGIMVKLPIGIDPALLKDSSSKIEIIPNGVTDEFFAAKIKELAFAYLPHKGYRLRGSGLLTSLLGSGIIVFAHESNSFMKDFSFSKLLIAINDSSLKQVIGQMKEEGHVGIDRKLEADKVNAFINEKWQDFLDPQNE